MSLVWITGGVTVSRVRDLTHSRRPRLGFPIEEER
jgi:hypothetical protein